MKKAVFLFIGIIAMAACNRSPEYYFHRGNVSVSKGQEMNAIQDYNKAILLKRNFTDALVARGMIYERMGDKQKAEQDYRRAVDSDKEHVSARNNLAALLMDKSNYKDAVEYLDQALEINRDNQYAVLNRGLAYYKLGKYNAAKADLNKAIRINPRFEMALYHRALISKKEKNYDAAIEDLGTIIGNNPNATAAWLERGKIYYRQKKEYALAAQDFKRADDNANGSMKALTSFWLAASTYQIGYYEQALESALASDEIEPNSAQTLGLIGDIYAKIGDIANAEEYYNKAAANAGANADAYKKRMASLRRK